MKAVNKILVVLVWSLVFQACSRNGNQSDLQVKQDIQDQLDKCVRAVNSKDIELYMDLIPDDFIIYDQSGEVISREKQKAYTLRDWSIIDRTLNNEYVADSIRVNGDSAIVFTSQRWERLMYQKDGKTLDTVLTTQGHIETWRKTKLGWLSYDIKELGGKILINGKEYRE